MNENSTLENKSNIDNLDRKFLDDCLNINVATEVIHPTGHGGEKKYAFQNRRDFNEDSPEAMTYCMNNGVLAFVRKGGVYYVTPSSPEKIRILEAAGYTKSGLGVVLSNGERPENYQDQQKWQFLLEKRDRAREQKN